MYACVSQIPSDESIDIPSTIQALTKDLSSPEAADPATRLRILLILGKLEINYDAASARTTWQEVASAAKSQRKYDLATRALGEQGIAEFILGDVQAARKQVVLAWGLSKAERDTTATVRYASIYGEGLEQLGRYQEALTPLNDAIKMAAAHPEIAYPTVAVYAKIDALAGLKHYDEALTLANQCLNRLAGTLYDGQRTQVYISRGSIYQSLGDGPDAIEDFKKALFVSRRIGNFRGITDAGGLLAQEYERDGEFSSALMAIDEAITANTKIPGELYLVPRNLAIKADIEEKMGQVKEADFLYGKSVVLVNSLIRRAPTESIQRELLSAMSDIYSGYFELLCQQNNFSGALQKLEEVRGRLETEALEHHRTPKPTSPSADDQELTRLNIALINTDDPETRSSLMAKIYSAELRDSHLDRLALQTITHPVSLGELKKNLSSKELLVEYVLAEPHSYALAITRYEVHAYKLVARSVIETDAARYRGEILARKVDLPLARRLFGELLGPMADYSTNTNLIIIPDGDLHLLPFSALAEHDTYVLASHSISVEPSSTVFELLRQRKHLPDPHGVAYLGVAAWTKTTDTRNLFVRAVTGPQRSQFVSLPASKLEVESIANDLPKPDAVLLGSNATEDNFKLLAPQTTEVIHLALHGYADLDYPERSALIFAPDITGREDGLLQVREIRAMQLHARLITLSACDTGVGPFSEAGIVNLVNAFIEAGADSVVSTLWQLEDHTTERLMTDFYAALYRHIQKVDALREAQLSLMNEGLPPYYWASFQIVGNPNSLT